MLIEAAGTRLAIDLLESLRKYKFEISEIRVSYISKTGDITFVTFENLDSLKETYNSLYGKIVASRRNPFTVDISKAQLTPIVKDGLILSQESDPINTTTVEGLCELGRFFSVENFKLKSTAFNFDIEYRCFDVSDVVKIVEGRTRDLRRNTAREAAVSRQKTSVLSFISLVMVPAVK